MFFVYFLNYAFLTVASPGRQDIDQLLDSAIKKSLTVQIQTYKVEETKHLGATMTAWNNPNFTMESQKGDDNTGMPINKHQFSLIQPLTSPWKTHFKSKIAKSTIDIENHHLEDQKLSTKIHVLKLLFQFNVAQEKIKRVDAHVKRIEVLNSFLSSRKFVSPQKQSEVFIVENKIKVLRKQLNDLTIQAQRLWLELNIYFEFENAKQIPSFWVDQTLSIPKDDFLQKTLTFNHDLELAQFEIEKSQSEVSYEKNQRLPDLSLTGSMSKGLRGNPEDNYTLGVQMSVPIFNANNNKLKASQLSLKQAQTKKDYIYQQIKKEFDSTYGEYQLSQQQIRQFPLQQLEKMERQMIRMTEQFKRGQVDLMTFVEADLSHDLLIDETLNIQINYVESLAKLSFLTGEMIPLKGVIHEISL